VLTGVDAGSVLAKPAAAMVRIVNDDAQPYVALGTSGYPSAGGGMGSSSSEPSGVGGLGQGGQDTAAAEGSPTRGGSLQIFDINLRGYDGDAEAALRRLQTLDGSLPLEEQEDIEAESDNTADKPDSCGDTTEAGAACQTDDGEALTRAAAEPAPGKAIAPSAEGAPAIAPPVGQDDSISE